MPQVPDYDDILAARARLEGHAVRTPLIYSAVLSERLKARIFLKPEILQRTGSFKFRGAWNAIQALGERAAKGVVACSSGNHAQGVAEAARLAGVRSVIVMPEDAPALKRRRTEAFGGKLVLYDRVSQDRDAIARKISEAEGLAFVHPFNDPFVIAGQGTVGLEIAQDLEAIGDPPDVVLVPCSGGGLAAGVALALTERFHQTQVYSAEPAGFDDLARSLKEGERQRNSRLSGSICDALLSPEVGAIGWEIHRKRLAGGVSASDEEVRRAVGFAFEELKLVVEPGGAVALAALLEGRVDVEGRTAVVVLSGGNIADEVLADALRAYRSGNLVLSASAA